MNELALGEGHFNNRAIVPTQSKKRKERIPRGGCGSLKQARCFTTREPDIWANA